MKRPALPPLVGEIKNGEITWEKIESVDHESLGYLLSCHLIIEHYVTEALKSANWRGDEVQWDAGRLSFSQKVAILPQANTDKFRDLVPCIKHLNSLRYKFSHNISFRLSDADLSPFARFLTEISSAPEKLPDGVTEILDFIYGRRVRVFCGLHHCTCEDLQNVPRIASGIEFHSEHGEKGKGQSDFSDWPLFMPATTAVYPEPAERTPTHLARAVPSARRGLT